MARNQSRVRREWWAFTHDPEAEQVANKFVSYGERFLVIPMRLGAKQFWLVFFYNGMVFTPKRSATGYLVLDSRRRIVRDRDACSKIVRSFRVWKETHWKPPMKHEIWHKFISKRQLESYGKLNQACKQRIALDKYESTADPVELKFQLALKKLDTNFVEAYDDLTSRVRLTERMMDAEMEIWIERRYETVQGYAEQLLPKLRENNERLIEYLKDRARIMVESRSALNDYLSETGMARWGGPLLRIAAILAATFNVFYGAAIYLAEEVARVFYRELTGYKSLVRKLKKLSEMQPRIEELIHSFTDPVESSSIRGVS